VNKTPPSFARILAMVVFAFSCFGLLLFLWLSFGGSVPLKPKGYRVQIGFPEATQLATQADVRVSGVPVGKVVAKRRDPGSNLTLATIELERKYAPLRADARATLRQKTLLGETFVELTLGSDDAPFVEEGGRLPDRQVQASIEVDEVLNTFDPFTRKAFRTWQQELGAAVDGRGDDLNDAFGTLPEFVESGGDLMEVLDEEKQALGVLIRDTGVVFEALTEREGQLEQLVVAQDEVFSAIADQREAWAETWRVFPTFLDESKATFERLGAFSVKAEPVVRDLEPAFRDLGPTLDAVGDLGPDLRQLFVDLDPLLTISRRSLPATSEVLDGLRPLLAELGPFLSQFNPFLNWIGVHVHTLSDMFANLGVATAAKVKNPQPGTVGHYLRQFGPIGPESLAVQRTRSATNRGNAYLNPLGVANSPEAARFKILPAFDCDNAGGERLPSDTAPGCRVQVPYPHDGRATRYPQLRERAYPEE
jgi:phospholipid/cholesterol/gamma-HCH transport system substrate-binding protein